MKSSACRIARTVNLKVADRMAYGFPIVQTEGDSFVSREAVVPFIKEFFERYSSQLLINRTE